MSTDLQERRRVCEQRIFFGKKNIPFYSEEDLYEEERVL